MDIIKDFLVRLSYTVLIALVIYIVGTYLKAHL